MFVITKIWYVFWTEINMFRNLENTVIDQIVKNVFVFLLSHDISYFLLSFPTQGQELTEGWDWVSFIFLWSVSDAFCPYCCNSLHICWTSEKKWIKFYCSVVVLSELLNLYILVQKPFWIFLITSEILFLSQTYNFSL